MTSETDRNALARAFLGLPPLELSATPEATQNAAEARARAAVGSTGEDLILPGVREAVARLDAATERIDKVSAERQAQEAKAGADAAAKLEAARVAAARAFLGVPTSEERAAAAAAEAAARAAAAAKAVKEAAETAEEQEKAEAVRRSLGKALSADNLDTIGRRQSEATKKAEARAWDRRGRRFPGGWTPVDDGVNPFTQL